MKKSLLFLIISFNSIASWCQTNSDIIEKGVAKDTNKFVAIYKDFHQNPELGFMEVRTASIIAKELKDYGYKVTEHIGETGIAAVLKNGDGPTVMYRADMDCNAVKETNELTYRSTKITKLKDGSETPVMHACGHDAHVTWMLATAKFFAEHKDLWKGTAIFIGQPAEEQILGAEAMVTDGLYTKYSIPQPDYLFGMHSAPFPVGVVAAASGLRQAGTDQFDVTFYGVGGHGSSPHVAKDPIVMAASAIMQYQTIISRGIDPKHSAVITVGAVQAGADNNVIPESALLKINLRWFDEKDRKLMIEGIKRINESIAYSYDLAKEKYPTIKFKGFSTPLVNSSGVTKTVQEAIKGVITDKRFLIDETILPSVMGSEDFHHLVIHNPKKEYCYINIGVAEPKKFQESFKNGALPFSMHNGNFQLDLSAIPFGSRVAINSLLAIFNKKTN